MQYLVVISTAFDDIPVRLFDKPVPASEFADKCNPQRECDRYSKFAGRDIPTPIAVRICKIRNGRVVSDEMVRDLEIES